MNLNCYKNISDRVEIRPECREAILIAAERGKKPVDRRPVLRRTGVRIAAAAAACGILAVSVSGYQYFNQPLVTSRFGVLGTVRLEDMVLLGAGDYTNGIVRADVDAVLCDGHTALVLMTFSAVDPAQKINWDYQFQGIREAGCEKDSFSSALLVAETMQTVADRYWVGWTFQITGEGDADEMTLVFDPKHETDFSGSDDPDTHADPRFIGSDVKYFNDATGGLEITFPITQTVPTLTMQSKSGEILYLSGYELYADHIFNAEGVTLCRGDGTQSWAEITNMSFNMTGSPEGETVFGYARLYETFEGVKFKLSDPDSYTGFIDVTDVTSMEVGGVMYYRTEG